MISIFTLSACLVAVGASPGPTPTMPQVMPEQAPNYFGSTDGAGPPGMSGPGPGAGAYQGSWANTPAGMAYPGVAPAFDGVYGNPGCPHCWHRGPYGDPWHDWWISPCNMSQRYPYWPKDHGYYYFRPYHMAHVCQHRDIAESWGEDPRNPYDHKVFDRVYESIAAEAAANAEVLPATVPEKKPEAFERSGPDLTPKAPDPTTPKQGANGPGPVRFRSISTKVTPIPIR
jgi:hypothetical protein